MKSLNKQIPVTVRVSRAERARLREAATKQARTLGRRVTPSEILREAGLARAAEILAAA